jgi:WD40 repeat protein
VSGTSGSTTETTSFCVEVGTGTCSAAPTSSGNFYVLNSNAISGFTISSSALQRVGSSQTLIGATTVAMAPSGAFLYVASTGSGITLYTISSSGALDTGVSFNNDGTAAALAVDPSGKWLLVADVDGVLSVYPITSSGTLDSSRNVQTGIQLNIGANGVQPGEIAISPNGAVGAVALGSAGTQTFAFNASLASPIQTLYKLLPPVGTSALSVAFDPQNRFLYVGEVAAFSTPSGNTGGLRVFTISGSTVTELSSVSPYHSGGLSPNAILPLASGSYVYVANGMGLSGAAGNVTGFAVASSGLTLGSSVAAGAYPLSLAEDSTHDWVFEVGSSGSPYFDAYTIDTSNAGQLASQVTSTEQATSIAIVAAP